MPVQFDPKQLEQLQGLFRHVYTPKMLAAMHFGPLSPPPTRWERFRWRVRDLGYAARVWVARHILRVTVDSP